MNKIENQSAFPVLERGGNGLDCTDPGMALRDWFAGQALAGYMCGFQREEKPGDFAAAIAGEVYHIADAMLAVRAGHKPIDIEHMLAACVPGGSGCDPQAVADSIREYWRTNGGAA